MRTRCLVSVLATFVGGCTQDATVVESLSGGGESAADAGGGATTTTSSGAGDSNDADGDGGSTGAAGSTAADDDDSNDDGPRLDVAGPETGGVPGAQCTLGDDISGIGPCDGGPLAESFEAEIQWSWGLGEAGVLATPLVANLSDDNGDGSIDLCDTPDVVVLARYFTGMMELPPTRIVALDGQTGAVHWTYEAVLDPSYGPALGDIDGDGFVEIVAVLDTGIGANDNPRLIAVSHDGQLEWESAIHPEIHAGSVANVALADLEGDGDVEIMAGRLIADHDGTPQAIIPTAAEGGVAVDLDGDGDLEYVHSNGAHHHDGSEYFRRNAIGLAFPHIADIDGDGQPEIVYSEHPNYGLAVYEHDGTLVADALLSNLVGLPGAIHDMNGDGVADLAVGHGDFEQASFSVIGLDTNTATWSTPTIGGCCAGGTAFDFLGDATAESIFADDRQLFVFDEHGVVLTSAPRNSPTVGDYPVVADVDNDGSAEIIVVSESLDAAPVQVIRDRNDGWVPARRIWNQYQYHVTNVREDGTIPAVQPKNWESLNTFRTQAQITAGGVCVPEG